MSTIVSMYWAWKQKVPPDQKFVLLAFAGDCGQEFLVESDYESLAEASGLDIESLKKTLIRLVKSEHLIVEEDSDDDEMTPVYRLNIGEEYL